MVLAHDVDDFSKIWQAMGRSRTMNHTVFSIYKSSIPSGMINESEGMQDVKTQKLTKHLYVHNCDCKMAGNISSIYLTIVALFNLSQGSFYYCDEIVNTFLDKMQKSISKKVAKHEGQMVHHVLGNTVPERILLHILTDKFKKSSNSIVAGTQLTEETLRILLKHIIQQKYEQRVPSGDEYDDLIMFLSGEQQSLMEISYTKQQQKQKQKQQTKNQDSDAMGLFDKKNRLVLSFEVEDYYQYALVSETDRSKLLLNLPAPNPILSLEYCLNGKVHNINVYPTLQFLYSHHIQASYVTEEIQSTFSGFAGDVTKYVGKFLLSVEKTQAQLSKEGELKAVSRKLAFSIKANHIRQNPQYTIAGLEKGVYLIGMKEQLNVHDVHVQPLRDRIQYIADDMGFILYDRAKRRNVDIFGPYFIEQYILMEVLSKQEVAQNVMEYYCNHKKKLQRGLERYGEVQGKGFICWRFLINETTGSETVKNEATHDRDATGSKLKRSDSVGASASKRPRASHRGYSEDADEVADGFARSLDI